MNFKMPSTTPNTLARDISPPPARRSRKTHAIEQKTAHLGGQSDLHRVLPTSSKSVPIYSSPESTFRKTDGINGEPGLAAVEAGKAQVKDHLAYFSHHLYSASRQTPSDFPRITLADFNDLYTRNEHAQGRHFVVHQHDHPISGSFNDSPSLRRLRR